MVRLFACALLLSAVLTASAQDKNPVVVLETSMGNIKIELFADKAPVTVKNFLNYVDDKFYDGTIFHRVIGKENTRDQKDFMIQGGGFEPGMKQKKTKEPIKNEAGLDNKRGTLAMARTSDPDSATAQFFINVADNEFLNKSNESAGYAVFGKVLEGMDVVDKIKAVKTAFKDGHGNVPVQDVIIKSAKRAN
jgi:peptidyl-prolyl cis-trans isomerase B (cyclophilin B)